MSFVERFLSMKYAKIYCALMLLCFSFSAVQAKKAKVLFIGNSITYYNDMPQTVRNIALQWGDSLSVTMYAPGGTGFANHVADPNVYNHFRTGSWDYVILQPGTGDSYGPPAGGASLATTVLRGKKLRDSIYKYSPCAKVFLYEIAQGQKGSTIASYVYTQDMILSNVTSIADSLYFGIVPAGEVIRNTYLSDTTILYSGVNDIHPNPLGSYGIACAFAAVICNKNTSILQYYNGEDPLKCKKLQRNADSICANSAKWRLGVYSPRAHFNFNQVAGNLSIQFQNTAVVMDSLRWAFGDGTNSSLPAPLKQYTNEGTYKVNLTTYKNGCTDSYDTLVSVGKGSPTSIGTLSQAYNVSVYPNPVQDMLYIILPEYPVDVSCAIYNLNGTAVFREKLSRLKNDIDLKVLPRGIYLIRIIDQQKQLYYNSKITLQ